MRKIVSAPTRGKNTLDQIATNMFNLIDSASYLPPIGRSDHQCVLLKPKNNLKIPPTTERDRLMKPGNRAALSLKVAQQTWERILRAEDVDEKVKLFNETVTHMLDTEVPVKTIGVHNSDKPWMTTVATLKWKLKLDSELLVAAIV